MTQDALLPCPFCGDQAYLQEHEGQTMSKHYTAQVACGNCDEVFGKISYGLSRDEANLNAIAAWNTRTAPASPQDIEGLKQAITRSLISPIGTQVDAENIAASIVDEMIKRGFTNSPAPSAAGDSTSMSASLNQQVETRDAVERGFQVPDGWRPIESAPDGKKIIVVTPIAMTDGKFFEPEIAYRNGDYWFYEPGDRLFSKPTHWMPLPAAPISAAETGQSGGGDE